MAGARKYPGWLPVALGVLLVVLVLSVALWLLPEKQRQASAPKPPVAYEDFQRLPKPKPLPIPPVPPEPVKPEHGITLILDDVGYDLPALKKVLDLHIPVAISVLPGSPHAKQAAEMAYRAGQVVMLHLPMEPDNPKYSRHMTDTFLRVGMDAAQIRQLFLQDLGRVPHVVGVNNHMGSHLTRLKAPMQTVMEVCREKGLFFVDSLTTGGSVAAETARGMGLSWAERRVFLDDRVDPVSLQISWDKALRCEKHGGICVVIAHPHPETVDFLQHQLSDGDRQRFRPLLPMLRRDTVAEAKS